jgi:hypothetical protein
MASLTKCDIDGCNNSADVIVSNTKTGDTSCFCSGHYTEFCFAVAKSITDSWESEHKKDKPAKPKMTNKGEPKQSSKPE